MRIESRSNKFRSFVLGLTLALVGQAAAQDVIKVGVIAEFSGPFADYGSQIEAGMKAYMKEHGDTVAGKKVELITRDTKGPAPEVAKRFAQELITRRGSSWSPPATSPTITCSGQWATRRSA